MPKHIVVQSMEDWRREDRLRTIFTLNIFAIIFLGAILSYILYSLFNMGFSSAIIFGFILSLILRIVFYYRKKIFKKSKKKFKKDNWERTSPKGWVIRKMKQKRKNFVNGENYQYMNKGGSYYRRLRR